MDEGEGRLERLHEILQILRSEQGKAEDYMEEIRELAGPRFAPMVALIAADKIHDRYEAKEITAAEAEAMIQAHADRYPAVPILFLHSAFYAFDQDKGVQAAGYLALYKMKSAQLEGISDFGRDPGWEARLEKLFARIEGDSELMSVWPYLDEGGGHLVNHFLVQEITDGFLDPEEEWADIIVDRRDELGPLLINMLEDQLRLGDLAASDSPAGLHTLVAMIGCRKSLEVLPLLSQALVLCAGDPLNEALLALCKLGALHPQEVSRELRDIAREKRWREIRLAAVDALGLLWEAPGNLDFLHETLDELDADDEQFDDLFKFLVHALLSTREPASAQAVSSALDKHLGEIEGDTALFTEDYLDHYLGIQLGPRLPDILEEEEKDFLRWPPSDPVREWRSTLTLQREDALAAKEEEGFLAPDLETVELFLRAGRNEPCACGSGLKFKKCCLPHMEELRDRLRRGEEVPLEKTPYAALMEGLKSFALLPSIRAEREDAINEFLRSLGRTWFERGVIPGESRTEEAVFDDWFLVSRQLDKNGRTVAGELLEMHGDDLDPATASLLRGLAGARFSVYEVREVVPGKEILLHDIFRDEELRVREKTASRDAVKWDLMATRVGEVGDHHELMGVSFTIPRKYLEAVETFAARTSKEMIKEKRVKDMDDFLQRQGYLILDQVTRLYLNEPMPTSITAEGDEFTLCTAVFDIGDAEEARRLLAGHPHIEDEGMKGGARRFGWHLSREMEDELRRGEHLGPQHKARTFSRSPKGMTEKDGLAEKESGNVMRGFGSLALKGKRLTLDTQSRQRLETGKRELESVLAGLATHRADTIQDQEAILGEAWRNRGRTGGRPATASPMEAAVPPEVRERILNELMERAYGNWLDEPIPYLDDKTPRQAAKTVKGRKKLNRLLQEYENHAERDKRDGKPAYDFSRFRRELDIWPDKE